MEAPVSRIWGEKLAVGAVGNMRETVKAMLAFKVVRTI